MKENNSLILIEIFFKKFIEMATQFLNLILQIHIQY